ncbi:hypothetical protein [Cyanothece sp. BG0011]|uniref:hypothetical protein n=1 Tax=Cyanothece sp. BG0011 TaxID=2082950 RepID=UPI000D1FB536|nr:hypothetical protein [Cyanothece sp. BG0011]
MLRRLTAILTAVLIAFIVMVKPVHAETNPFNEFSEQVYSIIDETGKIFSLPDFVNHHPEEKNGLKKFFQDALKGVTNHRQYDNIQIISLTDFFMDHPEYKQSLNEFLNKNVSGFEETIKVIKTAETVYFVLVASCGIVDGIATTAFPPAGALVGACGIIAPAGQAVPWVKAVFSII